MTSRKAGCARRLLRALLASALATGAVAAIGPPTAAVASGTNYYIDNSGSPICSNAFAGTSPSQPWCDFTNANGHTFSPGDSILLKSSDTFTQGIAPLGSGASGSPITIDSYGTGSRPIIDPSSSTTDAVLLQDPSYWTVNDLELTGGRNGIHANFTSLNHQGLTFYNLYIHNTSVDGIQTDGFNNTPQYNVPSGEYIVSGITVSWVFVDHTGAFGFHLAAGNVSTGTQTGNCCSNAQQDIVFTDDTVTNSTNNAFNLPNVSHVTVVSCNVDNADTALTGGGGTADYNVTQNDVTYVNDMYNNTPWASATDNSAQNMDNHLVQVRYRGDYFRGNSGSAIEYTENPCFDNCTSSTNTQQEISDNAFSSNSAQNSSRFYGDIDVTYGPQASGTIQDNLYYDTPQTYNAFTHSVSSTYWTLAGNLSVASDANLYNAPYQFSHTQGADQWSYQHWDGSSTSNTTYSSTYTRWSSGNGDYIWRFDMLPDACASCWTMRTWTAPHAGTISIRGWALKNSLGGDGVQLQINQGSTKIWGPEILGANDQVGFATEVTATVSAGDTIEFMVNAGSSGNNTDDIVSWAPSIGYTS